MQATIAISLHLLRQFVQRTFEEAAPHKGKMQALSEHAVMMLVRRDPYPRYTTRRLGMGYYVRNPASGIPSERLKRVSASIATIVTMQMLLDLAFSYAFFASRLIRLSIYDT